MEIYIKLTNMKYTIDYISGVASRIAIQQRRQKFGTSKRALKKKEDGRTTY